MDCTKRSSVVILQQFERTKPQLNPGFLKPLDIRPNCFQKHKPTIEMAQEMEAMSQDSGHSNGLTAQGASSDAGSPQLDHFHRFPELPNELRQLIFEACLPRRVFRFTYERPSWPRNNDMHEKWKPTPLPSIAFVCKEACETSKLYMKKYQVYLNQFVSQEWRSYGQGTRIHFNPNLDTLLLNFCANAAPDPHNPLESLANGPFALASMPKVNIVLEIELLAGARPSQSARTRDRAIKWPISRPHHECITKRDHCDVRLATTAFSATSLEIRSSGLFGLCGDERQVLIDIRDTAKIDQYETFRRQLAARPGRSRGINCTFFPEILPQTDQMKQLGAGRYSTHARATLDWYGMRQGGTGPDQMTSEQDTTSAIHLIKQAWLEANGCFEPHDNPILPWEGDRFDRIWDDEHHVAKHWLSKLPEFSFVVLYMVTEEA